MPNPKRAALYPRVSDPYGDRKREPTTERQQETPLDQQESACRAYAAQHGYTVDEAHVYREAHTGVELWERPKLTALREAIRRKEVDVVIAYSIDRLSRDPVHLGVVISEADHAGVAVEFVTEPLDNSPEGQLIRFVRGYAAKVEHAKIVDRTRRGKRARAEAGKLLPGPRPLYGYEWADETKARLVPNPLTAPTIERIYRRALAGAGVRTIANELSGAGTARPSGVGKDGQTRWGERTVWLMLTNPAYTGRSRAWSGAVELPAGTVPALVDEALFAGVQQRLKINRQRSTRNNHDPEATLLRGGYARCGYCGWAMHAHANRTRSGSLMVYRCSRGTKATSGSECQHAIAASTLDTAVWRHVSALLTRPELIAEELERMRRSDPAAGDLEAVERSLTQAARQQRNLIENLANVAGAAASLITDKINALDAQREQLSAEREGILARSRGWQEAQDRLSDLQAWCGTVAENLGALTYQERRLALEALGVQARVWRADHERRYEIRASIPLESADCVYHHGWL